MKKLFIVSALIIFFVSCKKTQLDVSTEEAESTAGVERTSALSARINTNPDCEDCE